MGRLNGKSIVVTGSGAGIGAGYARLAAAEGATVVVCDINEAGVKEVVDEITAAGGKALARRVDVTDWSDAEALVDFCVEQTGKIDGIINNAAIMHQAWAGEEPEDKFRRLIAVNVIGVAATGNAAIRQMRRQGHGVVINIVSGAHFGMKYMAAYGASKGAVASLMYTWSLENDDVPGIRVNAISPMGKSNINAGQEEFQVAGNANGGEGQPDPNVNAPLAVYLLSDAAAHVKGQIVRIDGKSLALVAHPVVLDPVLTKAQNWTIDEIEDAFTSTFNSRLVPTGLSALLKAEYVVPQGYKPY
ncbi:MAG: SDR family NAD(P)-dependent oxidoreductase [Acidimicrobiia bacterium]